MMRRSTATTGDFQYEENRDNEDKISMMVMSNYDDAEDDDTHDADYVEETVTIKNLQ